VDEVNVRSACFLPAYAEQGPMESPEEEVKEEFLWREQPRKRCASASHGEMSWVITGSCVVNKSRSGVPFNGDYGKD
jgi:hypothetical protein